MDCPRCGLMLRETDYEGVTVDMCDQCWGFWLDKGELEDVLESREMSFSKEERRVFAGPKSAAPAPPDEPQIPCPKCQKPMEQILSDETIQLVIDKCPTHGVWLDAGEIKAVQVAAEGSVAFHKLLLGKLRARKRD